MKAKETLNLDEILFLTSQHNLYLTLNKTKSKQHKIAT